jgi:hypothetical protein
VDLLTNAIESIQAGVEDYKTATRPRLLSAVRNIHSGILLLYKEALRRLSPAGTNDVLISAKVSPELDGNGKVVFVGAGNKTVDVQQIRERFDSLGISTDWKRFDQITTVRNDVEHRHPKVDQKALEGLVSNSFLIVRNFIADELHDDPLALLGEETWQAMLEVAEVHEAERRECTRLIDKAGWRMSVLKEAVLDFTCPACSGDLLKPISESGGDVTLQCMACGDTLDPSDYAAKALASALSTEAYIAMKDGDDSPLVHCAECGEKTFLTEEWECAACGAEPERDCARCGTGIPPEELDSAPFCGYCAYMMNKDD